MADPEHVARLCAEVERGLRRAVRGPIARVTGPDFEVVRRWADEGISARVVGRAIAETAERQRGRGQPVRIRVAYLDGDVRRIAAERRRRAGPRGGAGGRVRNCPRALGGCGALERGADDRCVHCGWERP